MKYIEVDVKKEDIEKGRPNDSGRCPIALALGRMYECPCVVGESAWITNEDGERMRLELPNKAVAFVDRFDFGKKVKPFSFRATVEA